MAKKHSGIQKSGLIMGLSKTKIHTILEQLVTDTDVSERGDTLYNTSWFYPLSQYISILAKPFLMHCRSIDDEKTVLIIAMISWNLAVAEKIGAKDLTDKFVTGNTNQVKTLDKNLFDEIVTRFIIRKNILFPDDMRFVLDYDIIVDDDGDGYELKVMSAPAKTKTDE